MQLTSILSLLALAATPLPTHAAAIFGGDPEKLITADYDNASICGGKNPQINTLIDSFCERKDRWGYRADNLTVGTPYARNGMVMGSNRLHIVGPNCPSYSKWIPDRYCRAQFHAICAHGGPKGRGQAQFGWGLCQTWSISPH